MSKELVSPEEFRRIRIGRYYLRVDKMILVVSIFFALLILFLAIIYELYLDYYLFSLAILAAFSIAVFPYMLYESKIRSFYRKIEDIYPIFLQDFAEAISSGMSLLQALRNLSNRDYKELTPFIKKLYVWVSWGMGFDKALEKFNKYFSESPLILKANGILMEAYMQGGDLGKTLKTVAMDIESLKQLEKDRRSQVFQQIITLYIIYFIFILLIVILKYVMEPLIASQVSMQGMQQVSGVPFGMTGKVIGLQHFKTVSTIAILLEGIFIPLVIGVAEDGKIKTGFKHMIVTLLTAILVVLTVVLPVSVKVDLRAYPSKPYIGQEVTISGTVTIDAEPAKGNVTLIISGEPPRVLPLTTGAFKLKKTFMKPGNYTIKALYIYNLKQYTAQTTINVVT